MNRLWKASRILFATFLTMLLLTIGASASDIKLGVGIVEASALRLRSEASTSAEVISTATAGDVVVVLEELDGWYKVNYNMDTGYMSSDYITFKYAENAELGDGMVNDTVVNLRSTPSTDGDLLCQISYGELCEIIGINYGWYKVNYGDYVGYIRSDLLDLTEAPLTNSITEVISEASGSAVVSQAEVVTTSTAEELVAYAKTLLGTPYVWGGTSTSGFDCSGFTQYVYRHFGYSISRTAASQLTNGTSVSKSELQPGDLVFFKNTYYTSASASHVGIYIGNGQFIHAASGGVKITSLSDEYYSARYCGARRIIS